jgi:hypothetical protein
LHPTSQGCLLPYISLAKFATSVCSKHNLIIDNSQ